MKGKWDTTVAYWIKGWGQLLKHLWCCCWQNLEYSCYVAFPEARQVASGQMISNHQRSGQNIENSRSLLIQSWWYGPRRVNTWQEVLPVGRDWVQVRMGAGNQQVQNENRLILGQG